MATSKKIDASLAGLEATKKSNIHVDPEGAMHGNRRGAKGVAVNLAEAMIVQQATDEAVEMAARAVAPYASVGIGLVTFLGRHGNDVTVPKYSELDVDFGRPVTLPQAVPTATPSPPSPPPSGPPRTQ